MKNREVWNYDNFNKINLPTNIGYVNPIDIPFIPMRVLDMPIYMPGQGFNIPLDLVPFCDIIFSAINYENDNYSFRNSHFVYVTIDQKSVTADDTGGRIGAHSDAYYDLTNQQMEKNDKSVIDYYCNQEIDHTYIWYDCFPTLFYNEKIPLSNSSDEHLFDVIARQSKNIVTYSIGNILKITPFVIHTCAIATETRNRTFVKVSISTKKFTRKGNTINPCFQYN